MKKSPIKLIQLWKKLDGIEIIDNNNRAELYTNGKKLLFITNNEATTKYIEVKNSQEPEIIRNEYLAKYYYDLTPEISIIIHNQNGKKELKINDIKGQENEI